MASPWETLGSKLVDQWLSTLLTPAFAFWLGGLVLTVASRGLWAQVLTWFDQPGISSQILGLAAIVLLAALSAFVVQMFTWAALRLLEGYWPGWLSPLTRRVLAFRRNRIEELEKKLAKLGSSEDREYQDIENRLLWIPPEPSDLMPTALGNALRTAESRPRIKYGLDGVFCWPRLWLLLPPLARQELSEARARLDASVQLCIWGAVFCLWGFSSLWALPIGIATAVFAYRSALENGILYGELIDSSYDLYRRELYTALRWPAPRNPAEEREAGRQLTQYLLRGSDRNKPFFVDP